MELTERERAAAKMSLQYPFLTTRCAYVTMYTCKYVGLPEEELMPGSKGHKNTMWPYVYM